MADRDTRVIAHDLRDTSAPDRNLALELVRVTESAALAAARWVGRGDKESADQAAVDAMRFTLHAVPMDGIVVIGEGEKDDAPMLYNGEQVGDVLGAGHFLHVDAGPRVEHRPALAQRDHRERVRHALGGERRAL